MGQLMIDPVLANTSNVSFSHHQYGTDDYSVTKSRDGFYILFKSLALHRGSRC